MSNRCRIVEEILLGICILRYVVNGVPDILSATEVAKFFLIVPLPQSQLVIFQNGLQFIEPCFHGLCSDLVT
jgi:hypothetical protein